MLKNTCIFIFCSFICFSFLSLRLQGEPLFNHLDRHTYPMAVSGYQKAEELCQEAVMRLIAWGQSKESARTPSSTVSANHFGHDTYNQDEKRELLNLLSGAAQKE